MSKSRPALTLIFALLTVFVCELIFPLFAGYGTVYAAPEPPEIEADSYLLADLKTGRVFMSRDIDTPQVPASLTKIMTLFIVLMRFPRVGLHTTMKSKFPKRPGVPAVPRCFCWWGLQLGLMS